MNILFKTENGEKVQASLKREELIYGITAIMLNDKLKKEDYVIHPLTQERIPIIYGNENKCIVPAHNKKDYELARKYNLTIKQVVAPYFKGIDKESIREDKKTEERHSVIAIIKHNKENKYLCLDCKNRECKSFVMGGIEEGESAEQAAIREVREETRIC